MGEIGHGQAWTTPSIVPKIEHFVKIWLMLICCEKKNTVRSLKSIAEEQIMKPCLICILISEYRLCKAQFDCNEWEKSDMDKIVPKIECFAEIWFMLIYCERKTLFFR
jgi:hypothetical protein